MVEPLVAQGVSAKPTAEVALAAIRRIAGAWGLDRYDTASLIAADADEFTSLEWSEDRLTRVGYLIELETALHELNPKFGVTHWIRTPNPGPFFGGSSPLQMMTGSTRGMAELLRQVRRWSKGTGRS